MSGDLRILVTSAARKGPLIEAVRGAAIRIDARAQVIAGDRDPLAAARLVADEFWQMPPVDHDQFGEVLAGCVNRGISVVLPTRDGELGFWARHRAEFASSGIHVLVSDLPAIEACIDKIQFSQFGEEHGLPFIPSWPSLPEGIPGTFVAKERFGAGSSGIGLDLSRDAAIAHAARLRCPIFQPFVRGPEISIDAWMSNRGEPKALVLRRRDRITGGESQVTTTFRDSAVESAAAAALTALGLRGHAVMQAVMGVDGLRIIECNPRFGGASTASLAVGLDSLHWSIREALAPGWQAVFERAAFEVRQFRLPRDIIVYGPGL